MTKLNQKFQKLKQRFQAGVEGLKSGHSSPSTSNQGSIDSPSGAHNSSQGKKEGRAVQAALGGSVALNKDPAAASQMASPPALDAPAMSGSAVSQGHSGDTDTGTSALIPTEASTPMGPVATIGGDPEGNLGASTFGSAVGQVHGGDSHMTGTSAAPASTSVGPVATIGGGGEDNLGGSPTSPAMDPAGRQGQDSDLKSKAKDVLGLAWTAVEMLLKRVEPFLDGTPAKGPVAAATSAKCDFSHSHS